MGRDPGGRRDNVSPDLARADETGGVMAVAQEQKLDILLVDDEEGHSELVKRNITRLGITNPSFSLTRGQDAQDYVFRRNAYEGRGGSGQLLILLDIKMPGSVDGVEV